MMTKVLKMILRLKKFFCRKKRYEMGNQDLQFSTDITSKYNLELQETEWILIRSLIEKKALALLKHEGKAFAKTGFDPSRYFQTKIDGRTFFIISTRVFYFILESVLIEACATYPEAFGIYRTDTILEAIYRIEPVNSLKEFSDFLKNEQFAWIIELKENEINSKILRVDLFRLIQQTTGNKSDFVGGLFHAFKHYSYNGIPLSTHSEINDLRHPKDILNYLIKGFFLNNFLSLGKDKYSSTISLNHKYDMIFHFYLEPITQVYFIASIRKQRK